MTLRPNSDSQSSSSTWSLGVALGAALAASACCTIPLALVSLGVGGAWIGSLTALAPYRWIFAALALGALSYAGYSEWRLSHRADCDCEPAFSPTTRRSLLGIGALAVLALIVSPWLVAPSPSAATQQAQAAGEHEEGKDASNAPTSFQQVVLTVDGMTCKACPITVRKALKEVEGVYSVKTSFKPPEAVVRFDPTKTSVGALTKATTTAGFPSQPKASF